MHVDLSLPKFGAAHGWFVLVAAVLAAQAFHYFLFRVIGGLARWHNALSVYKIARYASTPSRLLLTLFALTLSMPGVQASLAAVSLINHVLDVLYIVSITWLAIGLVEIVQLVIVHRLPEEMHNNIPARRLRTQVNLVRQIAIGLALFLGSATLLLTFPAVRNLGAGLFASAGVAGLVLGMAARPTIGNLIAGIQIAVTESIRIGDAVVVEGEYGRIVEVNTTNVVIRLWDLRHLIVPVSYFVEKSFQNWTRYSSDLIGAVHLQLDYRMRIEQLRDPYKVILEASALWDRKVMLVQVTDAKDAAMEVRFLMSAATPADTFDLRCHVREAMIAHVQQNFPEALPRSRFDVNVVGPAAPDDQRGRKE